jgi:hypothetical protein
MHGIEPKSDSRARNSSPKNGRPLPDIGTNSSPKTGTEFSALCKTHLGKSAGDQLNELTGYPRSTCYRYADGSTVPVLDFMAQLFDSEAGEEFFDWLMRDCKARWWRERERAREAGERLPQAVKNLRAAIDSLALR